ncbi:MAG: sigma-54-dependent transcriptional regulator [Pyrinomonadaceae bacterium]
MSRKIRVLLVDDDALLRRLVPQQLTRSGFDMASAESGDDALRVLREADYDVVMLDINMPGLSGLDALREIRKMDDAPEVIMLTADTSLGSGIEAMRHGAYDYLTKPSTLDEMEAVIRKADEKRRLVRQNASLRQTIEETPAADDNDTPAVVYESEQMRGLVALAENAARLDSTIVITGESGTGKDVLARFIHRRSARASAVMITINCGALPENLFESEFFGHEKGAFTGASTLKRGLLEAADGASLFLDEVGEMPLLSQVKLLQFLEQGRFRRVGSTRDQTADVRIIAATNRNLALDVREGRFRADLFYRLNVISLHVPPLRERRKDIPALVDHFLNFYRKRFQRPALCLSDETRGRLVAYDWPGNVRELRNSLERACALSSTDIIEAEQILPAVQQHNAATQFSPNISGAESTDTSAANAGASITLEELERQHILRVLEETGGNRDRTAAVLGISARTLYRKLREYETAFNPLAKAATDFNENR